MEEANVVTLYKKGNVEDPSNCRPISLLQSIYKIYAGMIKNRLADAIDDRMWKLQFGFRGKKSTAQTMLICRRLQDIIEKPIMATGTGSALIFFQLLRVCGACVACVLRVSGVREALCVLCVANRYRIPLYNFSYSCKAFLDTYRQPEEIIAL